MRSIILSYIVTVVILTTLIASSYSSAIIEADTVESPENDTIVAENPLYPSTTRTPKQLFENYNEPKNIAFMSVYGGSSHTVWVLSILDELSQRGHNITFITNPIHEKFVKPFPHFNTIVLDKNVVPLETYVRNKKLSHFDFIEVLEDMSNFSFENFETDYVILKNILATIDVAICDYGGSFGCVEAAYSVNTPYIITSAFANSRDASAPYINNNVLTMHDPTTLEMSFKSRFNDMFILPIKIILQAYSITQEFNQRRIRAGCDMEFHDGSINAHRDTLKIVNSLFGIEAARPLGPLVEMVGPILPKKYDPLDVVLQQFLDSHARILYIAFGQHVYPSRDDLKLILTAAITSIESGAYDGFLWAYRGDMHDFPDEIVVATKQYNVTQMFDGLYPDTIFSKWVPQMAVLLHESVSVFLTHGGAGSFYEGLYAGKRFITFPFFADQSPNGFNVKRNGMGEYLSYKDSQTKANRILKVVGWDREGSYQKNVNRYKALIQIHSRNGVSRGADLVEEVLFVSKDGLLPYRMEASRQMSFFKAYNIDLWTTASGIVIMFLGMLSVVVRAGFNYLFKKTRTPKIKYN